MKKFSLAYIWVTVLYKTVLAFFRNNTVKQKPSLSIWKRIVYTALLSIVALLIPITVFVFINVLSAIRAPIPTFGLLENRETGESTKLYDKSGHVLLYDTTGSMRRTTIPIHDISKHIQNATIAIEDATFYSHSGVRFESILRALLSNIETASFGQGGSTITQQLIKNTILTKDKILSRKIKEFVLALRIEKKYTKEQILETYLNQVPYGGTIYGVEEASRAYFNTPAKEMTLSQAVYIACLPKAPTYFSPWGNHRDALEKRHELVLKEMLEQNVISESEYNSALLEEVIFSPQNNENIKAPHFVFYVLETLEKKYGPKLVYSGQLQIITTLDWEMQQENEKIIRDGALENDKNFNASNAALVAIDPQSGHILAMVGSRNYFDDAVHGQVNVATALRQPGSVFKPFVYATAFKKGYTPDTVLFDLKTQFSTACHPTDFSNEYPCYTPENYDKKFRGPMTIREALAQSVNIVGVKALYLGGIKESLATARSLGITTLKDSKHYGLTLVLGGGEVTLLEMTGAYGTFANDGVWNQPTPILAIYTEEGEILESYKKSPEQVLEPNIARAINDILSDNEARAPAFGPNSPLYFENKNVASKTGTTNDYRDVWVIGYTPNVVVGAWAGNSNNTPMKKSVAAFILAPMWHTAMEKAIKHFPDSKFRMYVNSSTTTHDTYLTSTYFDPPQGIHEIFYWTHNYDKENLYNDEQIAQWGYPVALWAVKHPYLANNDSTRANIHNLAFGTGGRDGIPLKMSITTPERNSSVGKGKPFTVTISHSEIENVINVSYYLQGAFVGSTETSPFSFTLTPKEEGVTVLRAVAESPLGNKEALTTIAVSE